MLEFQKGWIFAIIYDGIKKRKHKLINVNKSTKPGIEIVR
jgi:hypothetical protein